MYFLLLGRLVADQASALTICRLVPTKARASALTVCGLKPTREKESGLWLIDFFIFLGLLSLDHFWVFAGAIHCNLFCLKPACRQSQGQQKSISVSIPQPLGGLSFFNFYCVVDCSGDYEFRV